MRRSNLPRVPIFGKGPAHLSREIAQLSLELDPAGFTLLKHRFRQEVRRWVNRVSQVAETRPDNSQIFPLPTSCSRGAPASVSVKSVGDVLRRICASSVRDPKDVRHGIARLTGSQNLKIPRTNRVRRWSFSRSRRLTWDVRQRDRDARERPRSRAVIHVRRNCCGIRGAEKRGRAGLHRDRLRQELIRTHSAASTSNPKVITVERGWRDKWFPPNSDQVALQTLNIEIKAAGTSLTENWQN